MNILIESEKNQLIGSKLKENKEQDYKHMIQMRNNRYGDKVIIDKNSIPDFEKQIPTSFNVKYRRSDALGIRNIIINENELIRADRPNMDKLVVLNKLKHEIRDIKLDETPQNKSTSEDDYGNNAAANDYILTEDLENTKDHSSLSGGLAKSGSRTRILK